MPPHIDTQELVGALSLTLILGTAGVSAATGHSGFAVLLPALGMLGFICLLAGLCRKG